jgi:glutamyl-tRNA synthetase
MWEIRVRIAPSPTGHMHIWTARAALFNYLFAKPQDGKFLIRIEDTDKERSKQEYTEEILAWLDWLGLNPDEDIVYQSKNESKHKQAIQKLLDEWKAYYAWETPEELEAMRQKARKEKRWFVFRQPTYTQEQIEQFKKEWRKPVVRFKVPENRQITYTDLVKWEISFNTSEIGDFVIAKSDWSPIFYLANVVDDYLMWITHVIRWEDHIPNTPKQILLYEALWYEIPIFGHLPLLLNPNKSKMSKRDTGDVFVTVKKFFQEWYVRDGLLNFIALLGWHTSDDREVFTFEELLKEFSIQRVQSSNAVYDFQRSLHFNAEHIKRMSNEKFIQELKNYVEKMLHDDIFKTDDEQLIQDLKFWEDLIKEGKLDDMEYVNKWWDDVKVRLQTLKQFVQFSKYLYAYQPVSKEIVYNKKMKVTEEIIREHLPKIIEKLEKLEDWSEENLKQLLVEYNKENWLKNWQTLWPIRAILSWVEASPGAFELMRILWKDETLKRLKKFKI